jgi:PAS domain S-box-containing protein
LIKVLYVDDEPLLLDICREFVQIPGEIEMDTASSVDEAEKAMSTTDYQVVVSDYQMPGISGVDFLKRLRSQFGHVPFILFTGRGREEVAIEALNCGADFYLQKGGDPSVQYGQLQKAIVHLARSYVTERSLALTQRRYSDLVEEVNAIAVKLDPEMRVTYVNTYGLRQLGWGNELVGSSFVDWLDKARVGQDEHPRHIFQAMFAQRRKGETFTHSFKTKDGEKRWVAWTCRFIRDDRQVVEEVLLFGTDVTEAKQNEVKLQRTLSLIKAAFDSSEEGILVTSMDRKVTEFNQRFLEMWSLSPGTIESGDRGNFLSQVSDQTAAPDKFVSFIEDVYAHPLDERRWTIEFSDGRKFEACSKPVMLGTEVVGRFWSFMDVTIQSLREMEFRIREENILGLLDNNKANMMILDPSKGDIIYANKAAIEFYGYGPDRLLEMRISDINTLDPRTVAESLHAAHSEKKQYFVFQHRLANGELRDVEVFSGPIEFEGRSLLFSLIHDISEMERAKRMVEKTELRHNRILNNLAIGILVSDESNKIVYANKTVQELLRRKPEEIVGLSTIDLVADEQKDLVRKNFAARLKGEKGRVEYRFKRGDGTFIWVQVTVVPLFDNGIYGGTIASVVDISEQRRDAEMIKASEKKFREIFNHMQDAVMIHEPNGMFLEVNDLACERFGYSREELLMMSPEDLDIPGEARDIPEKKWFLQERDSAIFETVHVAKDGRKIPSEINAIMIDHNDRPAMLVVCRDITERRNADSRLKRANEKLRILNSITRHDIMNQLMVLKGNLSLARSSADEPAMTDRLRRIERSTEIIDSQLQFAKDYQELGTVSPRWQNVAEIIQELPDLKDISEIDLDSRIETLQLYADPMLGKVFHNIMEDTVKYADRPVRVKIGFRMEGTSLVMVYEDHGPGIPAMDKEMIFEMGFGKGTGLGLHLCMEILSITDIRIKEAGEPGKGVMFEIEVPEGRFRFHQD